MAIAQYNFPTRIHLGLGAVRLLPAALKELGVARPLIVTDRGLAALSPVKNTQAQLLAAGLAAEVYAGVWGNPVKSQVVAGVSAFREHRADAVVGLGGGAAIDVAKAIALMAYHPGDLFDYEDDKPGARPIDQQLPVYVSVPTTAGTGSEVGRSTVISDDETHVKKIMFSPRLMAARVFADSELTARLPAAMTAATGMDALTHLIESYLAKGVQPMCDGIALEGVGIFARSFLPALRYARRVEAGDEAAVTDPQHIEARTGMLNAALMGGVAFQKGLGVTHSLAHALSTVCDLHHGLVNGICLPYAMAFNADVATTRLGALAHAVGALEENATGLVAWLAHLKAEAGIPRTLADAGVKREHLDRLVAVAVTDVCHSNNPKAVTERDFRGLFERALEGRLA
jgi:alcohol dehydrogenase class IV